MNESVGSLTLLSVKEMKNLAAVANERSDAALLPLADLLLCGQWALMPTKTPKGVPFVSFGAAAAKWLGLSRVSVLLLNRLLVVADAECRDAFTKSSGFANTIDDAELTKSALASTDKKLAARSWSDFGKFLAEGLPKFEHVQTAQLTQEQKRTAELQSCVGFIESSSIEELDKLVIAIADRRKILAGDKRRKKM